MKIIWKETLGTFGSKYDRGLVGKLCLFMCYYSYSRKEEKDTPYVLQIFCGQNDKSYRFSTEEECKSYANSFLKFLKEQLK